MIHALFTELIMLAMLAIVFAFVAIVASLIMWVLINLELTFCVFTEGKDDE